MNGKIIKIISNLYSVEVGNKVIDCHARGKFRINKITPLVGDYCRVDEENKYILEILPRKNELKRPLIANVDIALIIVSVKEPKLSLNLLDKMLAIILLNHIKPVICFSKLDLLKKEEEKEIEEIMSDYKTIGFSVLTNQDLNELEELLKNKIVVITGQTGVGKSSLLNKLDPTLNLKTDEISFALGRGKHTTRHVELFKFKDFYIADTPGFSSIDFGEFKKEDIRSSFLEFAKYPCPFKNCMHDKEKDCNVKNAVNDKMIRESRYKNYIDFIKNK